MRDKTASLLTMIFFVTVGIFVLQAAGCPASARTNYALIVAATDYPSLEHKFWLKGPNNDAILVRDYLASNSAVSFAPENIRVLATGIGLREPTHASILEELDRLVLEVADGDFVYLHFSGHGSEQPVTVDQTESSGRDQVFLPSDVKLAPSGTNIIPNALLDDDVGKALDAMRGKGAFVWVVFDSCHSGSMTRGTPVLDAGMDRKIDPEVLGITASSFLAAAPKATGVKLPYRMSSLSTQPRSTNGGLVAFFAAHTDEVTQEKPFVKTWIDGTSQSTVFGVFTYTLFSVVARNPGISYRQLAQSILREYAIRHIIRPTPVFEGDLDAIVFQNNPAATVLQWPISISQDGVYSIAAGQLQGLSTSSRLLIVREPSAGDRDAIGQGQIDTTGTLRSTLRFEPSPSQPASIPIGAFARAFAASYIFELRVSRPFVSDSNAEEAEYVDRALDAIASNSETPARIRLVESGEAADLRLAILSKSEADKLSGADLMAGSSDNAQPVLWLLPPSGEIGHDDFAPPTMVIPVDRDNSSSEFRRELSRRLVAMFRATGLSQLAAYNTFSKGELDLRFFLQSAGTKKLDLIQPENSPIARTNDQIHIEFKNVLARPVDINVLYVDHNFGITLLCRAHTTSGDRISEPIALLNDSDRGKEYILAVVTEADSNVADLSYLAQSDVRLNTRGRDLPGLAGLIAKLGIGEQTRGPISYFASEHKEAKGAVYMTTITVRSQNEPAPPLDPRNIDGGVRQTESCQSTMSGR